eukprot:Protomagalhaensia_sp_Gyna_25__2171@NODE_217_length_4339_cov_94_141163_g169_i0_p5_GENE_NODE_217_length_4339_cov_94_141163_g169_i0NODE_217_length_4339_cov_94_141163_g169_i0_p5_ORF_typecomplete_len208_score40_58ISP3_C/PF18045_1/1_2e18ISP1_C/PF18161_1/2_2e11_NODE_217_length_4339_cov_94_141163_g169_i019612584
MGGCCSSESDAHTELATASLHPLPPHGRVHSRQKGGSSNSSRPQPLQQQEQQQQESSGVVRDPPISFAGVSPAAIEQFMQRAAEGFEVLVLIASGHGIQCQLKVDLVKEEVVLSSRISSSKGFNESSSSLRKEIPFEHVTKVLYAPEELKRIRTEARLDDHCSALFTAHDASCIVFSFDSLEENQAFVAAAQRYIASVQQRQTMRGA